MICAFGKFFYAPLENIIKKIIELRSIRNLAYPARNIPVILMIFDSVLRNSSA